MLKVVNLVMTCLACPSQWEGYLEDGRMVYIRYRHGFGTVRVSKEPTENIHDAVLGEVVLEWTIRGIDGEVSTEEMLSATGIGEIDREEPESMNDSLEESSYSGLENIMDGQLMICPGCKREIVYDKIYGFCDCCGRSIDLEKDLEDKK